MGRRWGKTLMAGTYALSVANHGGAVAWVVPTYKNARPVWRFCERLLKPIAHLVGINKTERTVEFPSGGWLGVFSADNDVAIRGEAFDLVIVDEAARCAPETYTDVILPTLADRDGRCVLISTPMGLNWFFTEYQAAVSEQEAAEREGKTPDRAAWTAPSAENPIPQIRRAAELAKERVSERTYRQEWRAEFVKEGGVFRRVTEATRAQPQTQRLENHRYVFGVDWARDNDFTVISVIDETIRAQVAIERFNKIDYHYQLARLRILAEKFLPRLIVAEANSVGAPLIEQMQRTGLPVFAWTATNTSKADAAENLGLAFERDLLAILPDRTQLGELLAYEIQRLPGGMLRYSAPAGMHDDCCVALMLAWLAVRAPDGRPKEREFKVEAG